MSTYQLIACLAVLLLPLIFMAIGYLCGFQQGKISQRNKKQSLSGRTGSAHSKKLQAGNK